MLSINHSDIVMTIIVVNEAIIANFTKHVGESVLILYITSSQISMWIMENNKGKKR